MVLLAVALFLVFTQTKNVLAVENTTLYIHKIVREDDVDEIENTGDEMEPTDFDMEGEAFRIIDGAGFTVYDISDIYYGIMDGTKTLNTDGMVTSNDAPLPVQPHETAYDRILEVFKPMHKTPITTALVGKNVGGEVTTNGVSGAQKSVPTRATGKQGAVYVIVETHFPAIPKDANDQLKGTHVMEAANTILFLPIINTDGTDKATLHVYPKSRVSDFHMEIEQITHTAINGTTTNVSALTPVHYGDVLHYKATFTIPENVENGIEIYSEFTGDTVYQTSSAEISIDDEVFEPIIANMGDYDVAGNQFTEDTEAMDIKFVLTESQVIAARGKPVVLKFDVLVTENYEVDEDNNQTAYMKIDDREIVATQTANYIATGAYRFVKINGDSHQRLAGAEFELYYKDDEEDEFVQIQVSKRETGVFHVAPNAINVPIVSDDVGEFVIEGLADGTYYLMETQAPNGYVDIQAQDFSDTAGYIPFTVAHGAGDEDPTSDGTGIDDELHVAEIMNFHAIRNYKKGTLPSTGRSNAFVFYFIGLMGMLMCGWLFSWIRKLKHEKE